MTAAFLARPSTDASTAPITPLIEVAAWTSRCGTENRDDRRRFSSHHFSHPAGVTGWTSRLRLISTLQVLGTARYGPLRLFLHSQAECRRFEPGIPLPRKYRNLRRSRRARVSLRAPLRRAG